jgi:hydroxyacylglutathione hydrolase
MELEDNYEDIIGKAEKGLGKKVKNKDLNEIAEELNLNVKALDRIKNKEYRPKEFEYSKSYDGLKVVRVNSDFYEGKVNAYIVVNGEECVVIDTAQNVEEIVKKVKEDNLEVKHMLLTHGHGDHVIGKEKIENEFGVESLGGGELKEGQELSFGDKKIEVIKTPGHSEDSVTFLIGRFLFVGDLIFAGSLGGGMYNYEKLLESAEKVLSRGDEKIIFPGHGPSTSVGEERENNAFNLSGKA